MRVAQQGAGGPSPGQPRSPQKKAGLFQIQEATFVILPALFDGQKEEGGEQTQTQPSTPSLM